MALSYERETIYSLIGREKLFINWGDDGHYGGEIIPDSLGAEMMVEFAAYGLHECWETKKVGGHKFGTLRFALCREEARDIAAFLSAMADELDRREREQAERAKLEQWNKQAT
jgi:cytochrome c1